MKKLFSFLAILLIVFISVAAHSACTDNGAGATPRWTSADASQTEVNLCLASASSGDVVHVPTGSATWTATVPNVAVTIPAGVILEGNGEANTIITSGGTGHTVFLSTNSRVTGFRFINNSAGKPVIDAYTQGWRIDHNQIEQFVGFAGYGIFAHGIGYSQHPTGIVDHNHFYNQKVSVRGREDGYDDYPWYQDSAWGDTDETVMVEDNIFDFTLGGNCIDSAYSARWVFRYNTVRGGWIESHGARDIHGTQRFEAYRNTFDHTIPGNYSPVTSLNIRGGSGVVFDNECTGTQAQCRMVLGLERVSYTGCPGSGCANSKLCDGTSAWDTTPHDLGGSPNRLCRDQIGAGPTTSAGDNDGLASTPPPVQTSRPAYFWNSTYNSGNPTQFYPSEGQLLMLEQRDFWLDASEKAGYGLGGVSRGLKANIPAEPCTENNGYMATDEGSWNTSSSQVGYGVAAGESGVFYKCVSGAWTSYYTPSAYPDPRATGAQVSVSASTSSPAWTEADVVAGIAQFQINLSNTTWDANFGTDHATTTAFIAAITSDKAEAGGWAAQVSLTYANITQLSTTAALIQVPATAGYNITATERIKITIPASCTASGQVIVANPTVPISAVSSPQPPGETPTTGGATVIKQINGPVWIKVEGGITIVSFASTPTVTGSCDVFLDRYGTSEDYLFLNKDATNEWQAGEFTWTPATATNLRKIQVKLMAIGDISGVTATLQIFSDDASDQPDTLVTNATCTFSGALVNTGALTLVGCTTAAPFSLTNGTLYHVVADLGGTYDGTNHARIAWTPNEGGGTHINKSGDGSAWTQVYDNAIMTLRISGGNGCTGN